MTAANAMGYVLNVVAARRLGPDGYGALAALLGLVLVGYVPSLALQAVTTRRVAASAVGSRTEQPTDLAGLAVTVATAVGLICAVLAVPLSAFLHLGSPLAVLAVAGTLVPLTWGGFILGVAQGRERFLLLSGLYLLTAGGKVVGGLVGVALQPTATGVMAWTALGTLAGTVVATVAAREKRLARPRRSLEGVSEVAHASHSLLALFVLTNVDVLLARHFLPPTEAGLYGVGAVVAKVAFWLPQFVLVISLPRFGDRRRHRSALRVSAAVVALCGILVTAAVAVFGSLTVRLVAGAGYEDVSGLAWMFAALGSSFALVQLLLYARIARRERRPALVLWVAVAALLVVVVVAAHGSVLAVVSAALATAGCLVALGLAAEMTRPAERIRGTLLSPVGEPQPDAGQGPGV
jgi:O-antigen/teichoic acid export membrane protein